MTGTVEVVLEPFPPSGLYTDLQGTVTTIKTGGGTTIPRDGAVLVARGSAGTKLATESAVGSELLVRLVLRPQWASVQNAIGGGPVPGNMAASLGSVPAYPETALPPGLPSNATGVAGGPIEASTFDPNCRGHISATVHHALTDGGPKTSLFDDFEDFFCVADSFHRQGAGSSALNQLCDAQLG